MMRMGNAEKPVVLTGCSGSGKSATLVRIAELGYTTIPEVARQLMLAASEISNGILPWKDLEQFQAMVFHQQLVLEQPVCNTLVFMDRGLIDVLAYSRAMEVPELTLSRSMNLCDRYMAVFILDPLPGITTPRELGVPSQLIQSALHDTYVEFGYHLRRVPVMPLEERAQFILDHLKIRI